MSAAVVIHAGSYPYPTSVLSRIVPDGPLAPAGGVSGRPCRHATHMLGADGSAAVFALDGPLRERAPMNRFPSVRLRLRGARPLHATTAATWDARRQDQLAAYFTEASTRYRHRPAAGYYWADDGPAPLPDFPDDPTVPRPRPPVVGAGTRNRKNLSCVGHVIAPNELRCRLVADDAVATETRAQFGRRAGLLDAAAATAAWSEQREEVRRHRERMRQSGQVADLLVPVDTESAAMAGDSRSRFWSETARSAVDGVPKRCSTAPAQPPPDHQQSQSVALSYRRVSGNRVLSRMRDLYSDMSPIF